MTSITNLQNMPQLVLENITTFLNHKQLLVLEQVSKKLKNAVDDHFSITEHLILGALPALQKNEELGVTAEDKKRLHGFTNIIERCGTRLRTIQINVTNQFFSQHFANYYWYLLHLFRSGELVDKCPNIEQIITSPKTLLCGKSGEDFYFFEHRNVVSHHSMTDFYANQFFKLSSGGTCKLRSISLSDIEEHQFNQILRLYPKLERIVFTGENFESFLKYLPQFIIGGLKDLTIFELIDLKNFRKLCHIGKNLRKLYVDVTALSLEDISSTNLLELPKNVKLDIVTFPTILTQMNERIRGSIIKCTLLNIGQDNDCSSMVKMKNLESIYIMELLQLKTVAQEPFLKLTKIDISMQDRGIDQYKHDAITFLVQLLTNKGNQLTFIKLHNFYALDPILKALKHCKAAILVEISHAKYRSTTTNEELMAIFSLPHLQRLSISHFASKSTSLDRFRDLIKAAEKEATHFSFEFELMDLHLSFNRINI